jgi:hypothetical protein
MSNDAWSVRHQGIIGCFIAMSTREAKSWGLLDPCDGWMIGELDDADHRSHKNDMCLASISVPELHYLVSGMKLLSSDHHGDMCVALGLLNERPP